MAGIGGAGIGKAVGELAFGQPKIIKRYGNDATSAMFEGQYPDALKALAASGRTGLTNYTSSQAEYKPLTEQINTENIANLGGLVKSGLSFDPMQYYNDLLTSKVSGPNGIRSFIPDLTGANRNLLSNQALRLGINGTTNSAYNTRAGLSALGSSLAPILGSIYGGTGSEATSMANNRLANIASTVGLMQSRAGLPLSLANNELLPYQAESRMLSDQLGLAGNLSDITARNIQGYETKSNPWANLFEAGGAGADATVDTAAGIVQAYLGGNKNGGGLMSGGAGGATGNGGGYAPNTFTPPAYQPNYGYNGAGPAPGFSTPTYAPPNYGVLGPGSLGGYNYAAAPYNYSPMVYNPGAEGNAGYAPALTDSIWN